MKASTAILILAGLAGASIFAPVALAATTRLVCPSGCTYPTIQSAIDAAGADDTILIGKGHYVENLDTEGKKITLQGGADRRVVIIDGNGQGTVITIPGQKLVVVSDVTITRGSGDGGGIAVRDNGALNLRHSIVTSNHSKTFGGGIQVLTQNDGAGNLTIVDCAITNNDAATGGGGLGEGAEQITIDIRDSTFARNSGGTGSGGAIEVFEQADEVSIDNTSIVDNSAAFAGGIAVGADAAPINLHLTNSNIVGNTATTGNAGGVFLSAGTLTSSHSVFAHNTAALDGAAIYLDFSPKPATRAAFDNTWIIANKAGREGGGVFSNADSTTVGPNTNVLDNTPDNCPASQASCP